MQRFIFILLLSLSAIQCGVTAESNLRSSSVASQRRELSWWNMFLMHLGPHPHHHSSSSSNNSNNNNDSSGGEMSSQSGSDETTASVQSQYAETTDSSSSSSGSSGYGVFEDVAKYFSNGGDSANGSAGISIDSTSAANVFMFAAAALVAGLVGAALVVMRKVSIETDNICIYYLFKPSYQILIYLILICYSK